MDKDNKTGQASPVLPMISVIVPVYNGQDCLDNCIRSIKAGTYDNLEILIVNDGSTDDTGSICRKLKEEYPDILLLHTGGKGVSAARNAALDICKGEYISFVDADDRILPHMLELLYRDLNETQSDIAGCSFFSWESERDWERRKETVKESSHRTERKKYHRDSFIREGLLSGDTRCWSKLYKRETVGEVRFREDITIGEDILFLVDLLPHIIRVVAGSHESYGYYRNPEGAMSKVFKPSYMDQIICWETVREKLMLAAAEDRELAERKTTADLMMAVMLIIGKIAVLPKETQSSQEEYINRCHEKIKENLKNKDAFALLSTGYKIKILFFSKVPRLYMCCYRFIKKKKR